MSGEKLTPLKSLPAPWGKEVELLEAEYEGGLAMLRIRIREGKRFTILDLDPATASQWAQAMLEWAGRPGGNGASG